MSIERKDQKVISLHFKPPSLAGKRKACDHRKQTLARIQGGVMNSDIRISISFLDHPKIIKLRRQLGWEGFESLLRLWCWAAQYRPDGALSGMDEEDIEIAAQWSGEPGMLVAVLQALRLVDKEECSFVLHDWKEHNGWAAHAKERSEKARKAAEAKWNKEKNATSNATGSAKCNAPSNAPSPSPIPTPTPIEKPPIVPQQGDGVKIPFKEIIGHLSEKTGKRFSHTSKANQRLIRGRWEDGYRLEDFVTVIDNMTAAWAGDAKFEPYLRPATLFSASKFEGYLNQTPKRPKYSDGLQY